MGRWGFARAQLLILHPPYHNIIRFGEDPRDLSSVPDGGAFYEVLERVVGNFAPLPDPGWFPVLVIGDRYARGEWSPPGFRVMERVLRHGFRLKSICIRDIRENRGKRGRHHLRCRRALKGNFCIFRREYVMFLEREKPGSSSGRSSVDHRTGTLRSGSGNG